MSSVYRSRAQLLRLRSPIDLPLESQTDFRLNPYEEAAHITVRTNLFKFK